MVKLSLADYRQYAQLFDFKGHSIAYWQSDTSAHKDNLLLIHGFPSASYDWYALWDELSPNFNLIAFDLLGFGVSAKPYPHRYSLIEQADMVHAGLAQCQISDVHILAHDYGDSVAQELLRRHFEGTGQLNISSLCWLNGGLFAESHRALLTQKLLKSPLGPLFAKLLSKQGLRRSFKRIFSAKTPPLEEDIDILWELLKYREGIRVLPSLLNYIDERKRFRDVWLNAMQNTHVPLHFINGVHDPISGEHMLAQFETLVPNGTWSAIDAGHYPQLEAPEQVLAAFRAFHNTVNEVFGDD